MFITILGFVMYKDVQVMYRMKRKICSWPSYGFYASEPFSSQH